MTIRSTYAAESWDKVYDAFQQINFTSYDYETIKESLLQYLKIYHSEQFNDFIESSELIAVLEIFAYVAELLAYRVDVTSHENFISTAQRKQSVLKLARLISYRASRNIPARGLVKITTLKTSEQIFDSLGNDLSDTQITWNDPNNANWKEQFFLVANKVLTTKFGRPQKAFQIGDVQMQLYTFSNSVGTFKNGVFSYSAGGGSETFPMEIVPADIDENGPFERAPDLNSQLSIVYATDGKGDGSDYTGFLMFTKQGTLVRTDYTILEPVENRRIALDAINVNDTDVWVYRIDDSNSIIENWRRVEALDEQNLVFNTLVESKKKFEVETLENDRIALLFGDGNFSDAPVGDFQIWTRVSLNQDFSIAKNRVVNQRLAFNYSTPTNTGHSCSLTFSLTAALQNNAPSEEIEHIRQAAPATYYAQNRMVNGQDYNTYMLKDQSILKLKTINRTFAGQPKFIEWNDASRKYENVKLFGDDLRMFYDISVNDVTSTQSARTLIDSYLEPLLQQNGIFNLFNHISATMPEAYGIISFPRRRFIEDQRLKYLDGLTGTLARPFGDIASGAEILNGSLKEKTALQGALDRHFYGEPSSFVTIAGVRHGLIADPTTGLTESDGYLYDESLKRTIDGINTWPPGDTGSGLQGLTSQTFFGIRFNRFLAAIGSNDVDVHSYPIGSVQANGVDEYKDRTEVFTLEVQTDGSTITVISNIRGAQPSGRVGLRYSDIVPGSPIDFTVPIAGTGETPFEAGDAFILDLKFSTISMRWEVALREFDGKKKINLNGWFELISSAKLIDAGYNIASGPTQQQLLNFEPFNPNPSNSAWNPANSWLFLIRRDDTLGVTQSFTIWHRDMKLIVESPTTKFWYNQTAQIIDSDTKKAVYDKIRILRSNLDSQGRPLLANQIYDVVGFVYDQDGEIITSKLEVLPSDSIFFTTSGDGIPDNILQFEDFSFNSFQFGIIDAEGAISWLTCGQYSITSDYDQTPYNASPYDRTLLTILSASDTGVPVGTVFEFVGEGQFYAVSGEYRLVRRRIIPAAIKPKKANEIADECNPSKGLDFMWQHFSPSTHLIDPSVTNIHDTFILTRGYYNNMIDYIRGFSDVLPIAPTPLELRTSYNALLQNKMLSDTVVMHSGTIKLLFGPLAAPQLRAKFRVVKAPNASFSNERIKTEVISVIDTYFNIQNWDFGDKFYATELISLIHQRLASQISSVVIVPTFSINSFGSLFTIDSGFDEIMQSCATVDDVEMVDALTPTVLRQLR